MSSPIAKLQRSQADDLLVNVHKKVSHSHRIAVLADRFARELAQLPRASSDRMTVLDVGCGDMTLADAISERVPSIEWTCVDIHPCPSELKASDARWKRYNQFDGERLEFPAGTFDAVLFSDVIHHVPEGQRAGLLAGAARVGRAIVIKDHFEYGRWSRAVLRAMDFLGNYGYGVSVPKRYFRRDEFLALCAGAGLQVTDVDDGIRLYEHLPVLRTILSPRWQFLARCVPLVATPAEN